MFDSAASNPEWEHVYCAAVVAANTSMRPVEVKHLRRRDVDVVKKIVCIRRSKNETSHRVIPLNASALTAMARMVERADLLGHSEPDHFLWPACQWGRYDATQPMLKWDTAWRALRDAAGLPRFRFHDLRHTVITELAELGVAERVLESISGHLRGGAPSPMAASERMGGIRTVTPSSHARTARQCRWSWRSQALRHRHVTVCIWRDRRPPLNC